MKFYPAMARGNNPQSIILSGDEELPQGFEYLTDYGIVDEETAKEVIRTEIDRRQRHAAYHS